jgi:(R,R)-butanediol dehydrogenase/meso-butanediol dehydrogenase/diacetyl reductase
VRPGGVLMQTGLHTQAASVDMRRATLKDITIRGANCFPVDSWPRVIGLIASGALPVHQIVTSTVPLADAITAGFDSLIDPTSDQIKVVLEVSPD